MKMDLRLIAIDKNQCENHGYGEVAKQCSVPKYFRDKRKAVIACKALLNSIITSNAIDQEKESIFIPYLIVMGFEMHICVVHLESDHFYITQKVKSIVFPSRLADLGEESIELANGLLDLVAMCEAIKKQACSATVKQRGYGTSKTVWDNVDEHELEDEISDDEVDDDEVNDENDEEDNDDEGNNV
ncbi:uncharacterized protein B0P05DRAFT_570998 [Gilbertella persicaria]|uniref:uncharacterized protein n=1 Tax=Gilbertella persicaria TaxID=101096 RepID=UPI00221F1FD7|nr:uncharacterized protein B0P05DRAFT_570998 [Gilbertella persicaria]KAI8081917.1 hypothetical protein B0P05DRAFT_570998 [Gilbertella persicaria]